MTIMVIDKFMVGSDSMIVDRRSEVDPRIVTTIMC